LSPEYVINRAVSTAPTASTDPTERSRPPAIRTIVVPMAMIPIVLIPWSTLKMLRSVRKYGLANERKAHSASSASSTPASRAAKKRRLPRSAAARRASKEVALAVALLGRTT
jgi:hypothetical protein